MHASATFTFLKKVSREKSNLDLDWTCRDLDEVESASEEDGGVESDVRFKTCRVGLAGRPPFYARGRVQAEAEE